MSKQVRTRIAPSPTGSPHIGTAYIALHNYAFAKHNGGQFILRIEDTDQQRSTKASEVQILNTLQWLGLDWDEGPDSKGNKGPYRQSERLEIYQKYAWELVEKGKAYACFCTKERLDALRQEQNEKKLQLGYDGHCRHLDSEESKKKISEGVPYVIRLKVEEGETSFFDEVRQQTISFQNDSIDDQVLLKADGFPTYHLANVVDDHLMEITHVLRGEEWISSTPKHIMLNHAFGWEAPKFLHLPLLRNQDKSKISKRKNPTSLEWFIAKGYTKDSLINFLGLMGYSLGGDRELFTMDELIDSYDLSRLSTTAPIFDFDKLDKINTHYVTNFNDEQYADYHIETNRALLNYIKPLLPEVKKRTKSRSDLSYWTDFLFKRDFDYQVDNFRIKGLQQAVAQTYLKNLSKAMSKARPIRQEDYKTLIETEAESIELRTGSAYMLVRVAMMERQESLPLLDVMEFIGSDLSVKRLKEAQKFIQQHWPKAKS